MSARKSDPVIAACDRLRAADKAHSAAYRALDKVETKARASGFDPRRPMIMIAGDGCVAMSEARRSAKGMPAKEARTALDQMRQALAEWQQRRRAAGLRPYDKAEDLAMREWRAAMKAMATTRATSTKGVILKLKIIEGELRDGPTGFGEAIVASAIADLERQSRKNAR